MRSHDRYWTRSRRPSCWNTPAVVSSGSLCSDIQAESFERAVLKDYPGYSQNVQAVMARQLLAGRSADTVCAMTRPASLDAPGRRT